MSTRRKFIHYASGTLAAASLPKSLFAQTGRDTHGTLTIEPIFDALPVPADFIGLSYEVMQLEDPSFFAATNTGLIKAFRDISPHGILRLGGNTSEFSWWKPNSSDKAPVRNVSQTWFGEPPSETLYAVTPEAIRNLRGFLDATGWTCIYGLNLGFGTPVTDVAEATYVQQTLGTKLRYFQIGNEVDLFSRHLRDPKTWSVKTYLGEWLTIARAVQTALPEARFGMPDVANDVTWLPQIAELWTAVADKPNVVSLSHHHYFGGPPANPEVNIELMMQKDPQVDEHAALGLFAAHKMGVQLRVTEGNSCYGGGKPGVSDVFAAALWSADYCLQLMQKGYSGVNLHGGSGHAVAVSVGGTLTGEKLMADPTQPHPKPFYTPIANQGTMEGAGNVSPLNAVYLVEPCGFGLRLAGEFSGCTPLKAELHQPSSQTLANATVFAAKKVDGTTLIIVLNKDSAATLEVDLPAFEIVKTLYADSLRSHKASLDNSRAARGKNVLRVEPHRAALIRLL